MKSEIFHRYSMDDMTKTKTGSIMVGGMNQYWFDVASGNVRKTLMGGFSRHEPIVGSARIVRAWPVGKMFAHEIELILN